MLGKSYNVVNLKQNKKIVSNARSCCNYLEYKVDYYWLTGSLFYQWAHAIIFCFLVEVTLFITLFPYVKPFSCVQKSKL